jgi:redox-sensitive bicupin YhaK (pirin superfamily)
VDHCLVGAGLCGPVPGARLASEDPDDYRAGFPWHPRREIETVTDLLAGAVDHREGSGNAGTIGPRDAQWMTAGGGIKHETVPRPREGTMAGFQLWVWGT